MGFLDKMLGELVRRETGFNATRLIRKIGTRRLVMMGGAALAGGLLAQKAQQGGFGSAMIGGGTVGSVGSLGGSGSSGTMVVPPTSSARPRRPATPPRLPPIPVPAGASMPPVPTALSMPTEVPPLPVERGSADEASAQALAADPASRDLLYVIVRTMVAAALADGQLDAAEKSAIDEHLGESGLENRQLSQIRRDLVVPAAPGELAGMLPEGEDPEVLLQFAVLILRADGKLEDRETRWLESLAHSLGIEPAKSRALIAEISQQLFAATT